MSVLKLPHRFPMTKIFDSRKACNHGQEMLQLEETRRIDSDVLKCKQDDHLVAVSWKYHKLEEIVL